MPHRPDGQAEALLRLSASQLAEARRCADQMLVELQGDPGNSSRMDRRGRVSRRYLADTRTRAVSRALPDGGVAESAEEVAVVDWSPRDPRAAGSSWLPRCSTKRPAPDLSRSYGG